MVDLTSVPSLRFVTGLRVALAAAVVAFALHAGGAFAVEPGEQLDDPALEARARQLSASLRCVVCQNQSIDDSNAPLAKDLRLLVRERLTAGDSDPAVIDYIVNRYGEFVLLKPRLGWHTLLLWIAPLLMLGAAVGYIGWRLATAGGARPEGGAGRPAAAPLSADEEARVKSLLAGGSETGEKR